MRLVFALLLALAFPAWAAPLFFDDFESGDGNGWNALYQHGDGVRMTVGKTKQWSGDYAAKFTVTNPASSLQLEGTFTTVPKIYLRTALYVDPSFVLPSGQSLAIFGPANTSIGILDRISLKKRADGKLILSSQVTGDGKTVLAAGEWITLETMYAPGSGNGECAFWVNGVVQQARSDLTLANTANSVAAGALGSSWASTATGTYYLDDVEVDDAPAGPLQAQCTLHRPDLRGRAGAKILAVLNGWQSGWHFTASLSGPGLPAKVIYDNPSVQGGSLFFPLEVTPLARGIYTLTAVLLDAAGGPRAKWTGTFEKNYDHEARLTVDRDNNITLDGKLFFPVTPFGLPPESVENWVKSGYINCLYGQNWWRPTTDTMRDYAATGAKNGVPSFGPLNQADNYARSTSLVTDHANAAKDNPDIVAYTWLDEPDYNGYAANEVLEWWQTAKQLDGSRLTHMNLMGSDFLGGGANLKIGKRWTYPNLYADIYGFDLYPMSKPNFSIANLGDASDNLFKFNRGLIPFFAFVQTCNVDPSNSNSRAPTADELRVMAWVLVVHGAKGIQWYHYGSGTSAECFAAMAKFTAEITDLTPIVLSAVPAPAVNCAEASGTSAKVHVMSRQFAAKTYLFAANATGDPQTFHCALAGIPSGTTFEVAGQEAAVTYGTGTLDDTLPPFAVRIYSSRKPTPPKNLKATPQ